MNIHIETERFLIRDLEMFDAKGIFELDSDPEVHRYLGNNPISTIEKAEEIIRFIRNQYEEKGIGRWAVIDKKTKDFIGWTGFKYEEKLRKEFSYYDLGYRFIKKYWGMGIGIETAQACLNYGFTQLNFDEIFAAADINNIGSNKILTKIGLKFIETFDFEGSTCNWYGLHKNEWLKQ